MTEEALGILRTGPWQPKELARKGKVLTVITLRGQDTWAWALGEGGTRMTWEIFSALKTATMLTEGRMLIGDGARYELVLFDEREGDDTVFVARLLPSPAPAAFLSKALALQVLWRNKGGAAWSGMGEERWLYATAKKRLTNSDETSVIAPDATVLVTMASRFGDVGIRGHHLVPPGHGYDVRTEPENLTDWRITP